MLQQLHNAVRKGKAIDAERSIKTQEAERLAAEKAELQQRVETLSSSPLARFQSEEASLLLKRAEAAEREAKQARLACDAKDGELVELRQTYTTLAVKNADVERELQKMNTVDQLRGAELQVRSSSSRGPLLYICSFLLGIVWVALFMATSRWR